MKAKVLHLLLLVALIPLHLWALGGASTHYRAVDAQVANLSALPPEILRLATLEFDGIASDFLLLQAMVRYGAVLERVNSAPVPEWEWRRLHGLLVDVTELDPYFYDPYYLANSALGWGAGMWPEATDLLEKGGRHRDWDWTLPFFAGFNSFYFLQDQKRAAELLMVAARRPGASNVIATLAARMAYQGDRTVAAILFLEEMLKNSNDSNSIALFSTRLAALRAIHLLEIATTKYRDSYGHPPASLQLLVDTGLLEQLPVDPYGGTFYLDPGGAIKTTSNLY